MTGKLLARTPHLIQFARLWHLSKQRVFFRRPRFFHGGHHRRAAAFGYRHAQVIQMVFQVALTIQLICYLELIQSLLFPGLCLSNRKINSSIASLLEQSSS